MLRIVSQAIPPDNRETTYRRLVAEARAALEQAVAATLSADASFAERARAILTAANDACRLALVATLQATAAAHPDQVRVDGVLYQRHHEGTVVYHSLCGPLEVRRATYREVNARNGPTVVPLELAAGLIEGATPALGYRVALGYAQGPGRHAEEQMHADHRQPPSRSTLERVGKAIGTQTHRVAPRIEAVVRQEEALPAGAHAIVVGLDRTTVPMEEPRPAGAAPTTRRKPRTTPYVRTPPGPVDVNYRMAYVGTVSLVDRMGTALVTRRYAIAATDDPAGLAARMMADITRAREQSPRLPVGIVQDAAPELWTLLRTALTAETRLRRWHEGIDRYHLNERLAEILRLVESDERCRHQQLRRWNTALDTDDRAIDRIARWIAQQIPESDGEVLATLEAHWTYLVKNNDRMRYATLRRAGLPCGSGATEGACKSVVTMRTKRSGQRWHDDGVTAALTLRAVYLSERLPTLWSHFAADYSADVQAAA
jgi:hypothetical protein